MRERPLVDLEIQAPPDDVLDRFRHCLETGQCLCEGHVGDRELSLVLRGEERHTFSPWLSLQAYPIGEKTRLRGHFGPHPNLWTLFIFIYSVWVAVFVGGALYGSVQLTLGQTPWGLWAAGGAILAQAVACGIDLAGRAKGAKQMDTLRTFIRSTLPEAHDVPADAPLPHQQQDALAGQPF